MQGCILTKIYHLAIVDEAFILADLVSIHVTAVKAIHLTSVVWLRDRRWRVPSGVVVGLTS